MVAETGLYDSLGVSSSATPDEIRKAYRKMALKHHPDKNKDDPKAEGKFKEVGQAYEILSDPEKRKTYDQYGLEFILRGGPAPDAGGAGPGGFPQGASGMPGGFGGFGGGGPGAQSFHFGAGGGGPGGFQFTNANDIFSQFFSSGAAGGMGMGMDDDDPMAGLGGMGGMGGFGGAGRGGRTRMGGGGPSRRQNEVTVVERQLPVSLADLFTGTTKKLKLNRKLYDEATGKTTTQEKILTLPIKKGMKHGSKFKFSNAGDQTEGSTQDIHVILQEKPDEKFTRTDDDLRMDVELELKEALTGWKRTVTTIDGRQLSVSSGGPTQPTWVERFPGLGMPKSKKPDARGDFIVGVKINFPRSLTADQKAKLKEILP